MAQKRGNGEVAGDQSGREKKKLKMTAARTIAVQPNAQAGPSKPAITSQINSLEGLPATLDVERFVEARAFEIGAMQTAMKTASASSTHRVWQTLPRHLRRRAASHDVRRVPQRLRERARQEIDVVRKKALGRTPPKRGKHNVKQVSRTEAFLRRQRDKIWLETHIWHAKRMHMKTMWGYRLAVRPSEKAYRPSHRASMHDCIIHDASYYSLVEVKGPELHLKRTLDRVCDPQKPPPGSQRYLSGSRVQETHIYKDGSYPFGLIAPITVFWRPASSDSRSAQPRPLSRTTSNQSHGKEKAGEQTDPMCLRSVWLQFHPSVTVQVLDSLKSAGAHVLADYKAQNPSAAEVKMEILDLKGSVNVFEIMGPKSSQVIKGALSPILSEDRTVFTQFWSALGNIPSVACMPRGMVVGFKVNDPRLKFPPANAKIKVVNSSPSQTVFPCADLANNDLWDESIRSGLSTPRFKKKDLDKRRSKQPIPGTKLQSTHQDDRIPVLLIQRTLEAKDADANQGIHGWTLMIPAGWSMAFWSSLIYTGSRVGGQRERKTQAYEAGTAYFPRDYPFTSTYDEWATEEETENRETWERKPPAKRVNFESLQTKYPWKADWNGVLGISSQGAPIPQAYQQPAFFTTQREPTMIAGSTAVRPWLLRVSDSSKLLTKLTASLNHSAPLKDELNSLREKRGLGPLSNDMKPVDLLHGALVNICLNMCTRGTPNDQAMVYTLPDTSIRQWERLFQQRTSAKTSADEDLPQEIELANVIPSESDIIGYVTTGNYSLSRGRGFAIAAIPLTRLLELEVQGTRLHPNRPRQGGMPTMMVGVRNIDGMQCRAAYLSIIRT